MDILALVKQALVSNNAADSPGAGDANRPHPEVAGRQPRFRLVSQPHLELAAFQAKQRSPQGWLAHNPALQRLLKEGSAAPDALMGAVIGAMNGYVSPTKADRSSRDVNEDMLVGGALGAAFGPLVGHAMRKGAAWPFDTEGGDPETQAGIYRAKSTLSRVKLKYGAGFKKLTPDEQTNLLKAHDAYHKKVETAILNGQLRGAF